MPNGEATHSVTGEEVCMRKYQFATIGLCAFGLSAFAACQSDHLKFDDVDAASNEAALGGASHRSYPAGCPGATATGQTPDRAADPMPLPGSVTMTTAWKLMCG